MGCLCFDLISVQISMNTIAITRHALNTSYDTVFSLNGTTASFKSVNKILMKIGTYVFEMKIEYLLNV